MENKNILKSLRFISISLERIRIFLVGLTVLLFGFYCFHLNSIGLTYCDKYLNVEITE